MTLDVENFQVERTSQSKERTRLASERNRLANERTFLSWIRTGLAIIGGGIALSRLMTFEHLVHEQMARVAGVVLIGLGVSMFILSTVDYCMSAKELPVRGWAGSLWTAALTSIVLVTISILLGFILMSFK